MIKPYNNPTTIKIDQDEDKDIGNTLSKKGNIFKNQNNIYIKIFLTILLFKVSSISSRFLALLVPIKCGTKKSKKYLKQINPIISFNISFVIDNLQNANLNLKSPQFIY